MQYDFFFLFGWPAVPGGEPVMDTGDWRIQLQPDSRKRIVDKMYVFVS
jgi:PAX-interacting protein 1